MQPLHSHAPSAHLRACCGKKSTCKDQHEDEKWPKFYVHLSNEKCIPSAVSGCRAQSESKRRSWRLRLESLYPNAVRSRRTVLGWAAQLAALLSQALTCKGGAKVLWDQLSTWLRSGMREPVKPFPAVDIFQSVQDAACFDSCRIMLCLDLAATHRWHLDFVSFPFPRFEDVLRVFKTFKKAIRPCNELENRRRDYKTGPALVAAGQSMSGRSMDVRLLPKRSSTAWLGAGARGAVTASNSPRAWRAGSHPRVRVKWLHVPSR